MKTRMRANSMSARMRIAGTMAALTRHPAYIIGTRVTIEKADRALAGSHIEVRPDGIVTTLYRAFRPDGREVFVTISED